MSKPAPKTHIGARVDPQLKRDIVQHAEVIGMTVSQLIEVYLREGLQSEGFHLEKVNISEDDVRAIADATADRLRGVLPCSRAGSAVDDYEEDDLVDHGFSNDELAEFRQLYERAATSRGIQIPFESVLLVAFSRALGERRSSLFKAADWRAQFIPSLALTEMSSEDIEEAKETIRKILEQ